MLKLVLCGLLINWLRSWWPGDFINLVNIEGVAERYHHVKILFHLDPRRGFANINPEPGRRILLHTCLQVFILDHFDLFGLAADFDDSAPLVQLLMCARLVPLEHLVVHV